MLLRHAAAYFAPPGYALIYAYMSPLFDMFSLLLRWLRHTLPCHDILRYLPFSPPLIISASRLSFDVISHFRLSLFLLLLIFIFAAALLIGPYAFDDDMFFD